MAEGRFYWLKLKRDFFKRHDIQVIEAMQNGKDYVLFYLKLLVESIDHDGELRFSDTIPYNAEMLATITQTNIDIVRSAMKVFSEFGMVDILEDKTIYMTEVQKMIGSAVDNDNANRQRRYRERQKEQALLECYGSVTKNNESKSKSKSIEKDIDIIPPYNPPTGESEEKKTKRFVPPTVEEVEEYCISRNNTIDAEEFVAFYESKDWMVGKNKMKDWKSAIITWEKSAKKRKQYKGNRDVDWDTMVVGEELML